MSEWLNVVQNQAVEMQFLSSIYSLLVYIRPVTLTLTVFSFQKSDIPTYKRMWSFMQANADVSFVNSSAEGFERVRSMDYAYIAESTTIDYAVQRNNCTLDQVGGLLDSKGYGIATPKGKEKLRKKQ